MSPNYRMRHVDPLTVSYYRKCFVDVPSGVKSVLATIFAVVSTSITGVESAARDGRREPFSLHVATSLITGSRLDSNCVCRPEPSLWNQAKLLVLFATCAVRL